MVEYYYQQINEIAYHKDISLELDWATLLRMPDVMTKQEVEILSEEEWQVARGAINEALRQLVEFRKQEGEALQRKFTEKIDNIAALQRELEPYEKSREV